MDIFQNKLNFDFKTNQQILKLISYIDSFKGKWNIVEQKENVYLKELRKIATIESIGSSTRIEGAQLTNEEIKKLLENMQITKLKTRDQQEVVGYYDVLEIIYESFFDISISKNYIQQLHQRLLKYSTKDDRHRGNYKNLSKKKYMVISDRNLLIIKKDKIYNLNQIDKEIIEIKINKYDIIIDYSYFKEDRIVNQIPFNHYILEFLIEEYVINKLDVPNCVFMFY